MRSPVDLTSSLEIIVLLVWDGIPRMDGLARRTGTASKLSRHFRSGAVSETYFDKYRFEATPALYSRLRVPWLECISP
jgi:hypothetical protein